MRAALRPNPQALPRAARVPALALILTLLAALTPTAARAQTTSPVYVDDSARAADALVRSTELAAIGNLDEAVRVLQSLIDEEGDRVVASPGDPDLFLTVRRRVISLLLEKPALLERYRDLEGAAAERDLADGRADLVESQRLLTDAGFEATLRVAQLMFEAAQFDSAWRTLLQLDKHPARSGQRARTAADLSATIAGYLGAGSPAAEREARLEGARPTVERWRAEAEVAGAAPSPATLPPIERQQSVFDPGPEIDLEQLLAHPLWSAPLGDPLPLAIAQGDKQAFADLPEQARWLFASPRVVGDWVFVNDSQSVSAWNRFTLSERWRARILSTPPGRPQAVSPQNNIEHTSTVALEGDRLVAVMGLAFPGQPSRTQRIVGLEASTGRVLWSHRLAEYNEEALADASFAGPAIIDQGVAIVAVERDVSRRRLDSIYLLGLDLETGTVRWLRPLGSTGSAPYNYNTRSNESLAAHRGLVLRADEIGFISAVESVSGRIHWIRRLPGSPTPAQRPEQPWQASAPVVADGKAYVVSQRRPEIQSFDIETGQVIATCPASRFGNPDYLLIAGDRLVGVAGNTINSVPLAAFGPGAAVVTVGRLGEGNFRGRVVVAGDRLLAPTRSGVAVFDPTGADSRTVAAIALDRPGNILPLESQLLVVDDREVHTYLFWEVAERILRQRMDEEPQNPMPAVTYAELSYRAGRPAGIIPAVDRALAAIERDPLGEQVERSQGRLVRSLLAMLEPGPEASGAVMLDEPTRASLVDRLSRCASTPAERVAYLLAAGRFHEAAEQPGKATEAYQNILDRPELAGSRIALGGTEIDAQYEATRRLRALIQLHGRGLYDAYQQEADRELAAAAAALDPEPFEAVARRYPVARAAPRAWMEAATRYQRQGRPQLAAQALEEGLTAADDTVTGDDPLVGELAGRLVQHLVRQELLYPAMEALAAFTRAHPGLPLTEEGRTLDAAALQSRVRELMSELERRPTIGPEAGAIGMIRGWAVLSGLTTDPRWAVTDRLMMLSEDDELAVFISDGPGAPRKLWGGVHNEDFLWLDRRGAFFRRKVETAGENDRAIVRRHIDTGDVIWTSPPVRSLWPDDEVTLLLERPDLRIIPQIDTPLNPLSRITEVTIAFDRQTLVVVDRVGRAAGLDVETGRVLWAKAQTLRRMHDVSMEGGTLLIAGSDAPIDFRLPSPDAERTPEPTGAVLALDARSGQVIHRYQADQRVRWVRHAPEGFALVGLDRGVIALDPFRGRVKWNAQGKGLQETLAAWPLPGRVIVRRDDDRLWQIRTSDGLLRPSPLDARGRLDDGFGELTVEGLGDQAVVMSRLGAVMFDRDGNVIGVDARDSGSPVVLSALSDAYLLQLQAPPEDAEQGVGVYPLTFFSNRSLKAVSRVGLSLGDSREPHAIAIIDGKVLITSGAITTFLEAPPRQ